MTEPEIFVQIASYRDPQLPATVWDLIGKARHPERLRLGLCLQITEAEAQHRGPAALPWGDALRGAEVRLETIPAARSQGCCWARSRTQGLWRREPFTLQIDSHTRVVPDWDRELLAMWQRCDDPRAVISAYPNPFPLPEVPDSRPLPLLAAERFDERGLLRLRGVNTFSDPESWPSRPLPGAFIGAGMIFGPAELIEEVPYDPQLYFHGEELSLALRLWSHGFNVYNPDRVLVFHLYGAGGDSRSLHWEDHPDWRDRESRSLARLRALIHGEGLAEPFGLGTLRDLSGWERWSGVDLRRQGISPEARAGRFPPAPAAAGASPPRQLAGLPLPAEWQQWLRLNRERGCDRRDLFRRARSRGFDPQAIALALAAPELLKDLAPVPLHEDSSRSPLAAPDPWAAWNSPPLLNPGHRPRAWRLDTPLAQIVEIPSLLSREECALLMAAIDRWRVPSKVTLGPADYRTSHTCHLASVAPELTRALDARFAALLGVDPALAEPLQGQSYGPGQSFKAHTDWFAPGTEEFAEHCRLGGQRTWTLMVYLNAVERGGETLFPHLGRAFTPVAGHGLAWNNLHRDGQPNPATLHEALPVLQGRKHVITKWFRERPGRACPAYGPGDGGGVGEGEGVGEGVGEGEGVGDGLG